MVPESYHCQTHDLRVSVTGIQKSAKKTWPFRCISYAFTYTLSVKDLASREQCSVSMIMVTMQLLDEAIFTQGISSRHIEESKLRSTYILSYYIPEVILCGSMVIRQYVRDGSVVVHPIDKRQFDVQPNSNFWFFIKDGDQSVVIHEHN